MSSSVCPTCSCTEIDIVDVSGEAVCVNCGTILEENNIVSSIEFHESGGGAHSVVGQFVSSTSSKSYGNIGTSGRNYGMESRANTLANGKKKIRQIAGMLRLGDHYVDSAFRLFALALQRNFTHGRKAQTVIAACLYIVCRRERSPHLLIDFSDKLQINVYVLGGVFLKFCKLLQIHLPLIDPSLYIHRFASQLNFAGKTHSIATTALRLVATMKRDWIETGRRPSGICGAALLIAARSQSVMCSLHDVMDVVNIGERTLKQRLYEFSLTPTAQLTYDQVGKLEMSRVECDPPSFQRHREKEVMEMLLLESERLPLENGRKRARKATEDDNDDENDDEDEEDSLSDSDEMDSKTKKMKDEEMSRFLSGDAYYKKKHASALLSSTSGNGAGSSGLKSDDKKMLAAAALEDDDDDIDYGFENANEQIVNRASRLAAQEVLLRVRKKSARYIIRKREEADFYKTIERDLTLALEEEGSSIVKATLSSVMKEKKKNDTESDGRRRTVSPSGGDSDLEGEIGDEDGDVDEEEVDEEVEDAEDEDDEEEAKPVSASKSEPELSNGNANAKDERSQGQEDEQEKQQEDNFSDLDDEEINSLLLTKEEADKKKILWEKMNKDFIQEQEEKRLNGLNAPEVPKKKRRKKVPDANVPPPDTAQHAIYSASPASRTEQDHPKERTKGASQTVHTSSSKSARKKQEVNMATPNFARANQEMPPAGGFKPIKSVRGVPAVRGPPGWFMFLGSFALTSFGFYLVGQHNQNHRKLAAEERERRISMLPFLQAEADVEFLAQQEKVLEEERKIMKDVPGWTVGESTYHSDRYTVPLYAQKK